MIRLLVLPLLLLGACATTRSIAGQVVDRNGEGVARVNVKLEPGNVEIITDDSGRFTIDYLRDDAGERVTLTKRTIYEFEYFKVGFQPEKASIEFKRGELYMEPITLKEDTISVKTSNDNIDPGLYPDRAQNSGGSYEGE